MDQGENLNKQYWVNCGHLVVQSGGTDYSAKNMNITVAHDHSDRYICLDQLQRDNKNTVHMFLKKWNEFHYKKSLKIDKCCQSEATWKLS
jgi:hypothetical protein